MRSAVPALLVSFAVTCAAQAAEPTVNVPPGTQPVLRQIAHAPQAARIRTDIHRLVAFGTRHTLSQTASDSRGIGAARRWIESQFKAIADQCNGCLEVRTESDTVSGEKRVPEPTKIVDVLAIQHGTSKSDRYILMTAHLDSRATDVMDATSDAPGADDDGSGVAAVLEAARVLSHYRFPATIVYAALSGEEQGLFGGKLLARVAKERGWPVEAVLNNDIIGNIHGIDGVVDNTRVRVFSEGTRATETPAEARERRYHGGEVDSPSRNIARYMHRLADTYMPNLAVMMIYRLDRFGRGGDHSAFNDLGFPAIRVTEPNENYNRQHQNVRVENGTHYGDVADWVNFHYAAKVTGLNAMSLASMAWAPAPPAGVTIKGAVEPDTTLHWKKAAAADNVAGYRIYWRDTTSPTWDHSIYVGNVTDYTLRNVVIDNYFFGVASVSKGGFESPVVFPGSAGDFRLDQARN
ncbi:MAG: M28 family metallopeptidase [Gammaproteobacteria bacterium]|jgi:Zn-dependent M28 family amino/carboxypeptidase